MSMFLLITKGRFAAGVQAQTQQHQSKLLQWQTAQRHMQLQMATLILQNAECGHHIHQVNRVDILQYIQVTDANRDANMYR